MSTIEIKLTEMQNVLNENKAELLKVLTFSKDNKVPLALNNLVKESFSCKICHNAPMNVPILASRCLTSAAQIAELNGGTHTFRLVGIDEFLTNLQALMENKDKV